MSAAATVRPSGIAPIALVLIGIPLLDGSELWQSPLPFSSHATPMSYVSPQGKQTVVVTVPVYNSNTAVGLGVIAAEDEDPEGGHIIAYRLPD